MKKKFDDNSEFPISNIEILKKQNEDLLLKINCLELEIKNINQHINNLSTAINAAFEWIVAIKID
jgi:chaperonin cofactor prefoldin